MATAYNFDFASSHPADRGLSEADSTSVRTTNGKVIEGKPLK